MYENNFKQGKVPPCRDHQDKMATLGMDPLWPYKKAGVLFLYQEWFVCSWDVIVALLEVARDGL